MEPSDASDSFVQSRGGKTCALSVEHDDIVMVLGPVVANEDQRHLLFRVRSMNQ
jgi:hypothetical protein